MFCPRNGGAGRNARFVIGTKVAVSRHGGDATATRRRHDRDSPGPSGMEPFAPAADTTRAHPPGQTLPECTMRPNFQEACLIVLRTRIFLEPFLKVLPARIYLEACLKDRCGRNFQGAFLMDPYRSVGLLDPWARFVQEGFLKVSASPDLSGRVPDRSVGLELSGRVPESFGGGVAVGGASWLVARRGGQVVRRCHQRGLRGGRSSPCATAHSANVAASSRNRVPSWRG